MTDPNTNRAVPVSREVLDELQRLAAIGTDWERDSSLEKWFPLTGKELARLRNGLVESVRLQSHYAALLNTWDGGNRRGFATAEEWLERLDDTKSMPT